MRLTTKLELLISACLFLPVAQALAAQQPPQAAQTKYISERLDLVGNRSVRTDTLRALISLNPGDPYRVVAFRRDARSIWNTGFNDVRSEVQDSPDRPDAKIVTFMVREKPIVASIDYTGKSISESDIRAALKNQRLVRPANNEARHGRYQ